MHALHIWPVLRALAAAMRYCRAFEPPHPPTPITTCPGDAVGLVRRLAALVNDLSVPPLRPLHQLYPPLHPRNGCRAVDATFPRKKRGRGHNAGSIFPRYRENRVSGPSVRFSMLSSSPPGWADKRGEQGRLHVGPMAKARPGGRLPSWPDHQHKERTAALCCKPASLQACLPACC